MWAVIGSVWVLSVATKERGHGALRPVRAWEILQAGQSVLYGARLMSREVDLPDMMLKRFSAGLSAFT